MSYFRTPVAPSAWRREQVDMNTANIIDGEASVTAVAHAAMARTPDPRLRQLVAAFVDHMHALIREVNLTEAEFDTVLKFVTDIGQQTNDVHNEVVLAADVLGISTLVALRNNPQSQGQSAAALLGPFWRAAAPLCANGDSIARGDTPGTPMRVFGQVRGVDGQPICGAKVDVWQASPAGLYENQDAHHRRRTAQYHINADIAYSIKLYMEATRDDGYLLQYGAEIVLETARIWIGIGAYDRAGRYCINEVTGPDEYTALVNNNYYTNAMARMHLNFAAAIAERLSVQEPVEFERIASAVQLDSDEPAQWRRAAAQMLLPYDEALRIHAQDDSFLDKKVWDFANTPKENYPLLLNYHPLVIYRHQVCKQADVVLALLLLSDEFEQDDKRRDFDYYEKVTTHDSSLSSCIFSIIAAEVGYQVGVLDLAAPARSDVLQAMAGYDAVMHVAGIPHPLNDPAKRVFDVNVNGTFNVLEAAAQHGIGKVVFTSSESTMGFAFATHRLAPLYIPVDEAHAARPQDPYGLSKVVSEQICKTYTQRTGMRTSSDPK
eukprot:gene19775-22481_t